MACAIRNSRKGNPILTHSGTWFYPIDPRPEDIKIEDIAHSLSMQCRFNGHITKFYSVAEHCVRVASIVPDQYKLQGLLHDASEAYLSDIPTPLKKELKEYLECEYKLQTMIYEKYKVSIEESKEVKEADATMLFTEMRDLMSHYSLLENLVGEPLAGKIEPWSQDFAEKAFLDCFNGLI